MAEPIDRGYAGWQPKKCTVCGWGYNHPLSDSYAHFNFDCPACKSRETLRDDPDASTDD